MFGVSPNCPSPDCPPPNHPTPNDPHAHQDPKFANLLIGDAFDGDPARPRAALVRDVTIGPGTAKALTFCGEDKAIDTFKALLCCAAHPITSRCSSDAAIQAAGSRVAVPREVLSENLLGELPLDDLGSTFSFPFADTPAGVLKLMGKACCKASRTNTLATALAADVASVLQKSEWKDVVVPGVTVVRKVSAAEVKSAKRKSLALQAVVFMEAADADSGQKATFGGGGCGTMIEHNRIVDDVISGKCGIPGTAGRCRAVAMPAQDADQTAEGLAKEQRKHHLASRKRRRKFRNALQKGLEDAGHASARAQFFEAFPAAGD